MLPGTFASHHSARCMFRIYLHASTSDIADPKIGQPFLRPRIDFIIKFLHTEVVCLVFCRALC
jgi:hypothetical protein